MAQDAKGNYIEKDMMQYSMENMAVVEDSSIYEHYEFNNGLYLILEPKEEFKFSVVFGKYITHRFKTYEALEQWNLEKNHFSISIALEALLEKLKEKDKI